MNKKVLVVAGGILLLSLIVVSWAATSISQDLSITSGSTAVGGGVADVTALSSPFTVTQGQAQKISGMEMYRIDLGSASYKDKIKIHVYLLDPEDMAQVLSNPHAFIEVQVYYKVNSDQDYTLSDGTTKVKKTSAMKILSIESGDIILEPTMGGDSVDNDTYWVLGKIIIPGGGPPGQQDQLNELKFYTEVRL